MNRVDFEILARTPVPKLPPSYPPSPLPLPPLPPPPPEIWDQFVFRMEKYHIFVHIFYFNDYFWRYSLLISRNSYD